MRKLKDSIPETIPETSRCLLEMNLNEDLSEAKIINYEPVVEDDGEILLGEIILHLKDGRTVTIVPAMRGMIAWLKLKLQ